CVAGITDPGYNERGIRLSLRHSGAVLAWKVSCTFVEGVRESLEQFVAGFPAQNPDETRNAAEGEAGLCRNAAKPRPGFKSLAVALHPLQQSRPPSRKVARRMTRPSAPENQRWRRRMVALSLGRDDAPAAQRF